MHVLALLPPTHILLRTLYLALAATSLLLSSLPLLSRHLIAYGSALAPPPAAPRTPAATPPLRARLPRILYNLTVPHAWFTHFYILAVACNIFWAWQLATTGSFYRALRVPAGTMRIEQVLVVWAMMMAQAARRCWECLYVMRKGTSRMSALHYAVGWWFYASVSVALWIEGCDAIDATPPTPRALRSLLAPPSLKTFLGVTLWAFAAGVQHDAHAHLASLRKYSLPTHPVFRKVVAPHYTAEVAVYAGMALAAAGDGVWVNRTLGAVVVFVAVVLAGSARERRRWYREKWGAEWEDGKWVILPGVY